jgi:hypothetical protein
LDAEIADYKCERLSRLDICCHTDVFSIKNEDINMFKGRYYNDNIYRYRRKISGMYFGSGSTNKIYCRIYNKSLELTQRNHKKWFYDIWKKENGDCGSVWNIEFQLKREFLKEYSLDTVEQLIDCMGSIWDYLTQKWLVKVLDDRTRIENCSIDPRWQLIQKAFDSYKRKKEFIKKELQLKREAESMVPSIMGNISTYAAKIGYKDLRLTMFTLGINSDHYYKHKNTSFEKEAGNKRKLLPSEQAEPDRKPSWERYGGGI